MGPVTWRERLGRLWWDARHPITTLEREITLRYCRRHKLVLTEVDEGFWR